MSRPFAACGRQSCSIARADAMLLENLLVFGRLLRRAGIDVHPGRLLDVTEALGHVNLGVRDEVYHTCRALLVHRHEQIPTFDRAFDAFWCAHHESSRKLANQRSGAPLAPVVTIEEVLSAGADEAGGDAATSDRRVKTWSDIGGLADKDFAAFTADEIALARAALARLVWNPGERRTRRWVRGQGPRIDLRRAISARLRTGGD